MGKQPRLSCPASRRSPVLVCRASIPELTPYPKDAPALKDAPAADGGVGCHRHQPQHFGRRSIVVSSVMDDVMKIS